MQALVNLIKIANRLDLHGATQEADILDRFISKLAAQNILQELGMDLDEDEALPASPSLSECQEAIQMTEKILAKISSLVKEAPFNLPAPVVEEICITMKEQQKAMEDLHTFIMESMETSTEMGF